jgi:two-component system NarL family sensor kinase
MCDIAISLRQQLPRETTSLPRRRPAGIGSGADHKRITSHHTPARSPESRSEQRKAEDECQIIEHRTSEERLRELTTRVLQAQDEESRRIARELHDSAGQYLAAIQMNLGALEQDSSAPLTTSQAKRVSDSIEMVNRCTSEIRTISYLLHPPLLDELGLGSALAQYSEGFATRSGIRVELEVPKDFGRLAKDTETAIFRIVQQSLSNIYRHSGSCGAKIAIGRSAKEVTIRICDEGCGIAPGVLKQFDSGASLLGVGIAGMRERARALKGRFSIRSNGGGTTIEVWLPTTKNIGS